MIPTDWKHLPVTKEEHDHFHIYKCRTVDSMGTMVHNTKRHLLSFTHKDFIDKNYYSYKKGGAVANGCLFPSTIAQIFHFNDYKYLHIPIMPLFLLDIKGVGFRTIEHIHIVSIEDILKKGEVTYMYGIATHCKVPFEAFTRKILNRNTPRNSLF